MVIEFEDENGMKHRCAADLEIKGKKYIITEKREIYVQNEAGKYIPYTEISEDSKILEYYLEPPKSPDVIMPKEPEDNER